MERFDDMEINEKNGSTHTRGTYIISKDRDFYDINMGIKVTKSGIDGTGHGSVFLVVEQPDGNKLTFGPIEKTVGADALKGVNTDETGNHYRTKLAFDDPNQVLSWYLIVGASDIPGLPRSLDDVKRMVLENLEFMKKIVDIAVGQSMEIDGLMVQRTAKR
ncbi:hypothetical protein WB980_000100 [Bacillus cereus]